METLIEGVLNQAIIASLPTLEELQKAGDAEIAALNLHHGKLENIATDIQKLIQKYNAKKSILGHAAHWYGEQKWWLKILIAFIGAGIGILLYIPTIISIALSLAISFLLIDHENVATFRDKLITHDLVDQNKNVNEMLSLLNSTRENLAQGLKNLWTLHQEMNSRCQELETNVHDFEQKNKAYEELHTSMQQTIKELQENEGLLEAQVSAFSAQLQHYNKLMQSGTLSYVKNSMIFEETTEALIGSSKQLQTVTKQLQTHMFSISNTPPYSTPRRVSMGLSSTVVQSARKAVTEAEEFLEDYLSQLESQQFTTPTKK